MPNINLLPDDLREKKKFKSQKTHDEEQGELVKDAKKEQESMRDREEQVQQEPPLASHPDIGIIEPKKQEQKVHEKKFNVKKQPQLTQIKKRDVLGRRLLGYLASLGSKRLARPTKRETKQNFEVELLREDITGLPDARPKLIKLITYVVLVFLISIGVMVYYRYQIGQISILTGEQQRTLDILNQQIDILTKKQKDSELSFNRIDTVYKLLSNRVDWVRILEKFEALTLKNVYYTDMVIQGDFSVTMMARAKTIADAERQIMLFRASDDFITDVAAGSFIIGQTNIVSSLEETDSEVDDEAPEFATSNFIEFPLELHINSQWVYGSS